MALSFRAVQKAYEVFNKISEKHLPDMSIPSWPADINDWDDDDFERACSDRVYGCDHKSDDGWENLFFWTKNPTQELKDDFEILAREVPNSRISRHDELTGMWKFGWF